MEDLSHTNLLVLKLWVFAQISEILINGEDSYVSGNKERRRSNGFYFGKD